jgi:hypothetical protein
MVNKRLTVSAATFEAGPDQRAVRRDARRERLLVILAL